MSSVLDAADLRARVAARLETFLAEQRPLMASVSDELTPLAEAVTEMLAGGKRLRPAFCYWGYRGAGAPDGEQVLAAATSLELFQACALIHDDVMDDSDTRRGRPAVHRRFAGLHREADWHGDPEQFGAGAAILLGDLCLSWSDEMLIGCGAPPDRLAAAHRVFSTMRTELMGGQYLDILEQAMGGGSVDRAARVIRYKSAKYTIERPLHLGAALAGAPTELFDTYTAYGLPLGEAFQLRDDVLGVFGDPAQTGKPAGDDLREGKRTVLVAYAREKADESQQSALRQYLGDPRLDAGGVATLRQVLTDTGALDRTEQRITQLTGQATDALAHPGLDDEARQVLADLAVAATARAV